MAAARKSMRLKVVTPERVVFEGSARSLVAPAWDGWVGILPGHAPFLTLLGEGPLSVEPESGDRLEFLVAGSPQPAGGSRERTAGVMKVESGEVTVLADRVGTPPKNAGTERSGDSGG
ncbi:MAG: F0F1 ATP synthase subunit epsilon [Gemmatimonadota bacterium]|nr:F0F1 ATP synthase subunit epsilon [Gemmatimonadota bacterium]